MRLGLHKQKRMNIKRTRVDLLLPLSLSLLLFKDDQPFIDYQLQRKASELVE